MRKVTAVLVALGMVVFGFSADAARFSKTVLISYSQGDSLEQVSKWVDVNETPPTSSCAARARTWPSIL